MKPFAVCARHEGRVNLIEARATSLFLDGRFQTCRPTPDFCKESPRIDSFFAIKRWAEESCQKECAGDDNACVSLFMDVSNVCLGKMERR